MTETFSIHRRAHLATIASVFVALIVIETAGMHFILHGIARWAATLSSLSILLWLIADARSVTRTGITLDEDALIVRRGLKLRAVIPYAQLDAIATKARKGPALSAALFGRVDLVLRCKTPQIAVVLGRARPFTRLLLTVDDPDALRAALTRRLARKDDALETLGAPHGVRT